MKGQPENGQTAFQAARTAGAGGKRLFGAERVRGNRCLLLCRKIVAEALQECRCVRPCRQSVGDGGQACQKLRGELADQGGVVKIYAAYRFVFRRKQAFQPPEPQRAVVFLFGVAVRQAVIHVKIILPAVHAFLDGEQAQQKFGAVEVIIGVEALETVLFQGCPQLL